MGRQVDVYSALQEIRAQINLRHHEVTRSECTTTEGQHRPAFRADESRPVTASEKNTDHSTICCRTLGLFSSDEDFHPHATRAEQNHRLSATACCACICTCRFPTCFASHPTGRAPRHDEARVGLKRREGGISNPTTSVPQKLTLT